VNLTNNLCLVPRLRIHGAVLPLPLKSSWCDAYVHEYLYSYLFIAIPSLFIRVGDCSAKSSVLERKDTSICAGLDNQNSVPSRGNDGIFYLFYHIQTGSGAHTASLSNGYWELLPHC